MTAVEYLIEQLPIRVLNSLQKEIEQAKEMEKQQIIDAFSEGSDDGFYGFGDDRSEQYYNETYGSKGSDATSSQLKISDSCIPPESFTLSLDREEPPIIVIDKEGFKYKGELIEDKGEVYKLFKNYLTSLQTISDEEIFNAAKIQHSEELISHILSFVCGAKWYKEQVSLQADKIQKL